MKANRAFSQRCYMLVGLAQERYGSDTSHETRRQLCEDVMASTFGTDGVEMALNFNPGRT
ncbi:hypothetical protein [Peribacillus saganii]|uniref:hypothetical protein n=1 Tax=Peribacillus saganii TaxID=2303992 RepID=UPI000E3B9416|nr:hypothetical protein [Peribacillus saganii]